LTLAMLLLQALAPVTPLQHLQCLHGEGITPAWVLLSVRCRC
jgi:hypothetical protein